MNRKNTNSGMSFLNDQMDFCDGDTDNGLCLKNTYIPEEIMLHILSYIDIKEILKCSLVCRKWNSLIKSYTMWATIYTRKHNKKAKKLPWYVYYSLLSTNYFDINLLLNGNGQDQFISWEIKENGGNEWIIEDPPVGADLLPIDLPEFNNRTSCFATSYHTCSKQQRIVLGQSPLFKHILNSYKPHVYLSEWTAGRFDCGCVYKLGCEFVGKTSSQYIVTKPFAEHRVNQWQGRQWKKIEMTIMDYPDGVESITFKHEGCDTQFWAGHYGSKMAGGVIKLLFDSIEPLPVDEHGNEMPKQFSKSNVVTNAEKLHNNEPEVYRPRRHGGCRRHSPQHMQ